MRTTYDRRPQVVQFDDKVPDGVDPEAKWRFANSERFRRSGSTAAQRAGQDPNYTPGYGRSSANNSTGTSSITPRTDWDEQFKPQLEALMQPRGNPAPVTPPPVPMPAPSLLPPAALPPTIPPEPPSPGLQSNLGRPIETVTGSTGKVYNRVTGLPQGQYAAASFVPGQNSPAKLAQRKVKPVDPFS